MYSMLLKFACFIYWHINCLNFSSNVIDGVVIYTCGWTPQTVDHALKDFLFNGYIMVHIPVFGPTLSFTEHGCLIADMKLSHCIVKEPVSVIMVFIVSLISWFFHLFCSYLKKRE